MICIRNNGPSTDNPEQLCVCASALRVPRKPLTWDLILQCTNFQSAVSFCIDVRQLLNIVQCFSKDRYLEEDPRHRKIPHWTVYPLTPLIFSASPESPETRDSK